MPSPPTRFQSMVGLAAVCVVQLACGTPPTPRVVATVPTPVGPRRPPPSSPARPDETHLADLQQLTFGGENAEAYWSPDGTQLIFQARAADAGCDRIYRMSVLDPTRTPVPVSAGTGVTTCSFFLPGMHEVIYSSTHLTGPACPPRPDHSQGYVWALHQGYDIFRARVDGTNVRRLTDSPGYDAEATVCPVDGSIIFTSVRDGDLDLYHMDADGKHVRRLTHELGYDGGAFFDRDCSHIVWRASRPSVGPERDEYLRMLGQGLVRPTKLELWVAEVDGSDAKQITYLNAASFGPSFFPDHQRIIFSSNAGDPRGREFDLWAVDTNGTNLERLTTAPGFDGFPMFTADGTHLAFSSNRATAPGRHDTNVFVARWEERVVQRFAETPADRILDDIRWLAQPERGGRGVGGPGLEASGTYIEARLQRLGLTPAGETGSFRQVFQVPTDVKVGPKTALSIAGTAISPDDISVPAFAGQGTAKGTLVLAGYGIVDPTSGVDDYRALDVRGKIVVVRRFAPDTAAFSGGEKQRRMGDVRRKVFTAREKGARALIVVDTPAPPAGQSTSNWKMPDEAPFPAPRAESYGDAGIPVVFVRRAAFDLTMKRLEKNVRASAVLRTDLSVARVPAFNVVARIAAGASQAARLAGTVVIGAHYDHLGFGEHHSLAPDSKQAHVGADDNASGTATLLEVARMLEERRGGLDRDVVVVAFSGEEEGVLGSTAFTRSPPPPLGMGDVVAMVNLDMVGRMRDNRVTILGTGSADEWPSLLHDACTAARIDCGGTSTAATDGYGPSDQMPFYAAGIPVTHFFTGSHADYHRPSDTADKINAAGAGQIARAAASLVEALANRSGHLTLKQFAAVPAPGGGDMRTFGASLGTIPDYAGPAGGRAGVLLAGVRAGGAAEAGGLKRGDILVRLGSHEIRSVEDLMYALGASKPGETTTADVIRDGQELKLPVTFQSSQSSQRPVHRD
jgi:Peptidase family M28/PA domain/PDZ domain/WD40-like Beta Propeller Repeat